MTAAIERILARYGQTAILQRTDGAEELRAFLQPVTERKERAAGEMTALGAVDSRRWLYLGRGAVEPGDRVQWNGLELRVCSSRPYYAGGSLLYWWASLEQAREEA